MRTIKNITSFLIVAICFTSCNGILDFDPENKQESDDFYEEGANVALQNLTAIYNNFYNNDVFGFSFIGLTEIVSDNSDKGSAPSDTGRDKHLLDALELDKNNDSFNELWKGYYAGVTKVNKFLSNLEKLELPTEERARYEGEVKFLRAFYYFSLVRWFGDIPLVTVAPDDDLSDEAIANARTRAPKAKIYELIVADLKVAIASCPTKAALNAKETGRVTSTAAKALLAKVHLNLEQWGEVITLTEEITAEGLSLYPDYALMFREAGENNSQESIFEIQCSGSDPAIGIPGYYEIQAARGLLGWGFNTPSENLLAAYEANDLRKDATVIEIGETMWDGFYMDPDKADATAPKYFNEKVYVSETKETYSGQRWQTNKNLRVLRYAEVLLMHAEAHVRQGATTGEGLVSLNKVRGRAGLNDLGSYNVDDIIQERRVELAFEHDRWFDLIRTRTADQAMTAAGKTWSDKCWLFPIPQIQVDLSGGRLTQNTGY